MHIDRYMTDLFFEICKTCSKEEQADLKVYARNLGERMVLLHRDSTDLDTREKMKSFWKEPEMSGWLN